VVKNPRTGSYYQLGEEEHFLLTQLDGWRDADEIRANFALHFEQPLADGELEEFLEMAEARALLRSGNSNPSAAPEKNSLLYWRKSLFDPDRLFTWLAPRLWFFWTPVFLVFSLGCILVATALAWEHRIELARQLGRDWGWETAGMVWLGLLAVTMAHEFAHGLTCKRYGGEVHEVGFFLLFLMPCFYCNVSDAWLFREKSKRLWVMLAGGYFELFLWALAVFAWRLALPSSLPSRIAIVVVSVCGLQTLFNFNPLLKLDGYYMLSDWLEVPNLRQQAGDYVRGYLRWLVWGAPRPEREQRSGVLLCYGLVSGLYSLAFLALALVGLVRFLGSRGGLLGLAAAIVLGALTLRTISRRHSSGEVNKMLGRLSKRSIVFVLIFGAVPAALFIIPIEDRTGGSFQVRPATRVEVRAPLTGFLRDIHGDEGDQISAGAPLARLEVPDLASRLAQKQAEVRETGAKLRLLEAGPRHEEVAQQRFRVERAGGWRDQAKQHLAEARQALGQDLARLEKQIAQCQAELDYALDVLNRSRKLREQGVVSHEAYREAEKNVQVCRAQGEQARAQERTRRALGVQDAEAELAKREKELADVRAALALLEAGTRPEEVEAERARLDRLQVELHYLQGVETKVQVASPVAGVITTPHLREKVGQYVHEGDLICAVEELAGLNVEIALAEQDVARVRPGQTVDLKARALPFSTFPTLVDRVAPEAGPGEAQSNIIVTCRLPEHPVQLRPGMTGYARIYLGRRLLGEVLVEHALRYVRTEFWW
jgi:multidrug efflux pump subunit AcrA (membrane-fusion protein)